MTLSLRQIALLLIAGVALLQVFGIGSGVDRIGLLFISVALLSAMMSSLGSGMQAVEERQDSSESTHRNGNDSYRVFTDASGGLGCAFPICGATRRRYRPTGSLPSDIPKGLARSTRNLKHATCIWMRYATSQDRANKPRCLQ
jgi:hypothetical protein